MKLLAVFTLVIVLAQARYVSVNMSIGVTLSEEPQQLTQEMIRICVKETELSMAELQQFNNHDFRNSTEATQCFAHCIYEQMGFLNDGVFVEHDLIGAISALTDPKRHVPAECRALKGQNKCESAFKIHQCVQEHKSKVRA